MPTLLELQQTMRGSLVQGDHRPMASLLSEFVATDRLDIYRNTILASLTKALRLCYPAVLRLVGEEFFEAAVQLFITQHPPETACLDQYGGDLPEFLRYFQPAASLPYLADVARLEWSISSALHAPDAEPLDLSKLASVSPDDRYRVRLAVHPSV